MGDFIIEEGQFLLHSVILGTGIAILYDCLRIFRRVFRHSIFWISVEDLLYWAVVSVCIFYLLYYENNGAVRWFAIMGAALGMLLFKKTLSPVFVRFSAAFWLWGKHVLMRGADLLTKPFRQAGRAARGLAGQKLSQAGRKGKQAARILKKRLTVGSRMIKIILCKRCRKVPRGK